jgi:integrase/recombinase XerD
MPTLRLPAPWQAVADAFLRSMQERSGSVMSRDKYENILSLFFADATKPPDAYTRADVQAFLDHGSFGRWNTGAPVGVSCRNARLSALRSFYIFAVAYDSDNPSLLPGATPVRGFRYIKPALRYRAMSAEELQRFFSVIPDTLSGSRDRALFLVYFWTARRHAEIARLQWGDIEQATIIDTDEHAHEGFVYRYVGKGHSREVKTKELPEPAHNAIMAYLARAGRLETIALEDPVFCSVYPGRGRQHRRLVPLTAPHVCARFRVYRDLAGLNDSRRLTVHSLRHTSARLRRQSGSTLEYIKELLDHTSLQTTDLYLSVQVGESDPGAALMQAKYEQLSGL